MNLAAPKAPIASPAVSPSALQDPSNWFFYFVAVALGLAFSVVLLLLAWRNAIEDGTRAFAFETLTVNERARQNLRATHAALEASAAFLAEVPPAAAADGFDAFAAQLRARNPFMTGLVWYQRDATPAAQLRLMARSALAGAQFPLLLPRQAMLSWPPEATDLPDYTAVTPRVLPREQTELGHYGLVLAVSPSVRWPGTENWVVAEIDSKLLLGESTAASRLGLRLYLESEGIAGRTLLLSRSAHAASSPVWRVRELDDTAQIRFERYSLRLLARRDLFWRDLNKAQLFTATILGLGVTLLLIALARARQRQAQELSSRARLVEEQVGRQTHELAAARDEAVAASRVKSDFLAAMSHEIRTPLNAILVMAELLSQTPLEGEQNRYVGVLGKAGEALLDIVNDTLDLAKIDALQLELEAIPFDLPDLIEGAAEMHAVQAAAKGLALLVSLSADLPVGVMGDPSRLRQVLLNLIGNALKFTERGVLYINAWTTHAPDHPPSVTISVRDTGIGIPADRQQEIFHSFTQADASVTRKYGGTGLGLTISRKLVALMGGELQVRSEEQVGSEFWFTLALAPAPPSWRGQASDIPLAVLSVTAPVGVPAAAKLRVLLVEDNHDNRLLITAFLQKEAIDLEEACNGAVALARVQERPYDLVLMDIQMPVMDGLAATRAIRSWELAQGRPPVPIIALTAHAIKEDEEKSLAAGCSAHLTKPIRKQVLLAAINRYKKFAEA